MANSRIEMKLAITKGVGKIFFQGELVGDKFNGGVWTLYHRRNEEAPAGSFS